MVWFVMRGGMCAKADVEAWWDVRRLKPYESAMESPWSCCLGCASQYGSVYRGGGSSRCQSAHLFIFTTPR